MAGLEDFLNKYFPPTVRGKDKEFAEGIPQATYVPDPDRRWELSYEGEIPLVGDIPGVRQPTYNIVDVPQNIPVPSPQDIPVPAPQISPEADVQVGDIEFLPIPPPISRGYSRANVPVIPRTTRVTPDFSRPEGPRGLFPRQALPVTPKLEAPNVERQPLRLPKPPKAGLMSQFMKRAGPAALLALPFTANAYQEEGMSPEEAIGRAWSDYFGIESLGGYDEDAYFEQLDNQPYSEALYGYPDL